MKNIENYENFKLINEGTYDDFMGNYHNEIATAIKQLKEISMLPRG